MVPTVRCSAGIIEWTKEELKGMDRKARKIITIYGGLHPRLNAERLYLPRSDGSRGLVNKEDCVSDERENLTLYALGSSEKLIIAATAELKLKKFINVQNRQERRKQRLIQWKEKDLHGQFLRKQKELMIEIDGNG